MSVESKIEDDVKQFGWSVIRIEDRAPFAYTIGFTFTFDHPELIICGLREPAHSILATMAELIRAGGSFIAAKRYSDVLYGFEIEVRKVDRSQHTQYFGYAMGYCREHGRIGELQALQIFWPDKAGRFPSESECVAEIRLLQPRLDLPFSSATQIKADDAGETAY